MVNIVLDPESLSLDKHFAVVHTPRKSRKRFSAACVTVFPDQNTATAASDSSKSRYPAIVYGPSVSSESQRIYYLVKWL